MVAEQIGKLATDSQKSAVNTRELIVKTIEEINKGNEITASVAQAFEGTINEMQKFADVAKETNESARNQAEIYHRLNRVSSRYQVLHRTQQLLHRKAQQSVNSLNREPGSWISLLITLSFIDRLADNRTKIIY